MAQEGDAGRSVLIVDDSEVLCKCLHRILSDGGYFVKGIATSGKQAVKQYDTLRPDFVTLDIDMPEMNGTEVLKRLLEMDAAAKVIMVTAVVDTSVVMECVRRGAVGYIAKPFDAPSVLERVQKALKK